MNYMNDYQRFITLSRYARWIENENRRETWEETVTRLVDYFMYHVKEVLEITIDEGIWYAIYDDCWTCIIKREYS